LCQCAFTVIVSAFPAEANQRGRTFEASIALLCGCARLRDGRNAAPERSLVTELFANLGGSILGDTRFGQVNVDHGVQLFNRKEDA
jgi:hypothetical protein